MKIRLLAAGCCAGLVLLGSGCVFNSREVTVDYGNSLRRQREYFRNELSNSDGLALESENYLRGNLLLDDLTKNPGNILNKLKEVYRISGDTKYLIISADLCRYLAVQKDLNEALPYHLASFYYTTSFARAQDKAGETACDNRYNFASTQCVKDYNDACCGIFNFLKSRKLLNSSSISLHDAEGRKFVIHKPVFKLSVPSEAIEDFSLCASYSVKNLRQINRRPGFGVPLVANVKLKDWYKSLKTPNGLNIPVTLLVKRTRDKSGAIGLYLIFIDTGVQEDFSTDADDFKQLCGSLALDFSTPLACHLDRIKERNLLSLMLNPLEQEVTDGLYMVEPYLPNKIPVVFIHGLMSSPETWVQMINSLKNDQTIRRRYQFWFFSYSTGSPVMISAFKLRNALLAAQKEFCTTPEATANFNKMVLVGHSMGGMLTRQMLIKEPHYMMESLLKTPWDSIKAKLQPEDFKLLEEFAQPPLPFVHRAVFLASPHRGAEMAQSPIARLGAYIIKLPESVLSRESAVKRIISTLRPKGAFLNLQNRFYTGIDNLDPDNPFVLAHGNSKMKDDLIYHCVIGNNEEEGVPGKSDGVVPYWSSHLDGAASELVVKSDHSVHRRPAAIQELLRILLLHLKSVDGK